MFFQQSLVVLKSLVDIIARLPFSLPGRRLLPYALQFCSTACRTSRSDLFAVLAILARADATKGRG